VDCERRGDAVKQGKVKWGSAGCLVDLLLGSGIREGRREWSEIAAICVENLKNAEEVVGGSQSGDLEDYGSYEELCGDGEIEAIYNPLPNHCIALFQIKAAGRESRVVRRTDSA